MACSSPQLKNLRRNEGFLIVDTQGNTLNRLKDYLSRFWVYYQSNKNLQNILENA